MVDAVHLIWQSQGSYLLIAQGREWTINEPTYWNAQQSADRLLGRNHRTVKV